MPAIIYYADGFVRLFFAGKGQVKVDVELSFPIPRKMRNVIIKRT